MQHGLCLAECAYDYLNGGRRKLDQSRGHEYSVYQRTPRLSEHIHDFYLVSIREVHPAKCGKVGKRLRGVRRIACDIESELKYDL